MLHAPGGRRHNPVLPDDPAPVAYWPVLVLATAATVIASQAVITGAYSMTQQAMQLGFLPRMDIRRTSETVAGQIYVPQINMLLLVGRAVPAGRVQDLVQPGRRLWHGGHRHHGDHGPAALHRRAAAAGAGRAGASPPLVGPLLAIDLIFLAANALKMLDGGWSPVALGAA